MAIPKNVTIKFPGSYHNGNDKIAVIKAIRSISYQGLKEAKDLSETCSEMVVPVVVKNINGVVFDDAHFEEQCRILRNNGCEVGDSVHLILQGLRDLAADALTQGDDELANEIMQLVLAEKLRRK